MKERVKTVSFECIFDTVVRDGNQLSCEIVPTEDYGMLDKFVITTPDYALLFLVLFFIYKIFK